MEPYVDFGIERPLVGTDLLNAVKTVVSRLGWTYQHDDHSMTSPESGYEFVLTIKPSGHFKKSLQAHITNSTIYYNLVLYGKIRRRDASKFAATLHDVLPHSLW